MTMPDSPLKPRYGAAACLSNWWSVFPEWRGRRWYATSVADHVRMTIADGTLKGEMYRLDEPSAPSPHFTLKDTFELTAARD